LFAEKCEVNVGKGVITERGAVDFDELARMKRGKGILGADVGSSEPVLDIQLMPAFIVAEDGSFKMEMKPTAGLFARQSLQLFRADYFEVRRALSKAGERAGKADTEQDAGDSLPAHSGMIRLLLSAGLLNDIGRMAVIDAKFIESAILRLHALVEIIPIARGFRRPGDFSESAEARKDHVFNLLERGDVFGPEVGLSTENV
jgi:hypothetical protein